MHKQRDYIYYDYTKSLCPECLETIDAKIVFRDSKVWMLKNCKTHGESEVMIADDVEYYKQIRNYNKQSEMPLKFNTKVHFGCPYDCGLCTDHEQHSCLSIVEVTDRCNLICPTCYANSAPNYGRHRTLEEINRMFDTIVENEGEPDVVQISGGEPTVHPQFFEILDLAKSKPIKHLMLNTNGIRIAKDKNFVEKLASYMPDFEIYLQFDSFKPEVLKELRGEDLTEVRKTAIENLNEFNLSTTLVIRLQKGLNDDEMGEIIDYALKLDNGEETDVFPMTRYINPEDILNNSRSTIVYEHDERIKEHMTNLFSTGISVDCAGSEGGEFQQLMCCLPTVKSDTLDYSNLFRIIIMNFMDANDFDVRAVKKSCVHIVSNQYKMIPFETMNLLYRDGKIKELRK